MLELGNHVNQVRLQFASKMAPNTVWLSSG